MLTKLISTPRIGILGGTFDPPHLGHTIISKSTLAANLATHIWWMPNNKPPHKPDLKTSGKLRLKMCELATQNEPRIHVSNFNFQSPAQLYPNQAIPILKKRHPTTEFSYIIGLDVAMTLPQWNQAEDLLSQANIIVLPRTGQSIQNFQRILESFPFPELRNRFQILDIQTPPFSSSDIRTKSAAGQPLSQYLDPAVVKFISSNLLYRD